eukprot:Hpha_TRINITY_DN8352_c0_g1::TRINITY_DN8352_c0_g1_i1::g.154326::m.154326
MAADAEQEAAALRLELEAERRLRYALQQQLQQLQTGRSRSPPRHSLTMPLPPPPPPGVSPTKAVSLSGLQDQGMAYICQGFDESQARACGDLKARNDELSARVEELEREAAVLRSSSQTRNELLAVFCDIHGRVQKLKRVATDLHRTTVQRGQWITQKAMGERIQELVQGLSVVGGGVRSVLRHKLSRDDLLHMGISPGKHGDAGSVR